MARGFLKLSNLHVLIKQESQPLLRNLALRTLDSQIANFVFSKDESAMLPLFNHLEVLSFAPDKAKFFAKNFSKSSNLDNSRISLPLFPFRINLNQFNIPVTLKMFKKVITNLDLPKMSGPDWIPVVVLKNCEPELSCMPVELFNVCLKESCFSNC